MEEEPWDWRDEIKLFTDEESTEKRRKQEKEDKNEDDSEDALAARACVPRRLEAPEEEKIDTHLPDDGQLDIPHQVMKMFEQVYSLVSLAGSEHRHLLRLEALQCLFYSGCKDFKKQSVLKAAVALGLLEKVKDVLNSRWDGRPLHSNGKCVLLFMSLAFLHRVSLLGKGYLGEITTPDIIDQLMRIIDFQGPYFMYHCKTTAYLEEVNFKGSCLVTQVVEKDLDELALERLHQEAGEVLIPADCVQGKIKVCELCNLDDLSWDARESMLEKNLAWPRLQKGGEADVVSRPDKDLLTEHLPWQPICITSVVNGGLFWAQVGENNLRRMEKLQEKLTKAHQERLEVARGLCAGSLVLAKSGAQSCPLVRAQVIDRKDKSGRLTVFCVDYGHVRLVDRTEVFVVPPPLALKVFPRLASLCCLPDVQAPPVDEDLLQMALCVLGNVCRQSKDVVQVLCAKGLPQLAMGFLSAPSLPVATQAANVLRNMTCLGLNTKIQMYPAIIDHSLAALASDVELTKLARERIHAHLLTALTNIVYQNSSFRKHFYNANGLHIVAKTLRGKHHESSSYKATVRLFRNLINSASVRTSKQKSEHRRLLGQQSATGGRMRTAPREMPTDAPQCSEEPLKLLIKQAVQDAEQAPVLPDIKKLQLVRGKPFPFEESCVVSLLFETFTGKFLRQDIAPILCGMLNRGLGGMVAFGIKAGMVEGIALSYAERDAFGLGVNQMIKDDIIPTPSHFRYFTDFLPVKSMGSMKRTPRDHTPREISVPVITIAPGKDELVYLVRGDIVFYRIGENTIRTTIIDLLHLEGPLKEMKLQKNQERAARLEKLKARKAVYEKST